MELVLIEELENSMYAHSKLSFGIQTMDLTFEGPTSIPNLGRVENLHVF